MTELVKMQLIVFLTFGLGGGLFVAFFYALFMDTNRYGSERRVARDFLTVLISVIVLAAVVLLTIPVEGKHVVTQEYDLVALHDNTATSGSFFLGSGYFGNYLAYQFYLRNADGGVVGKTLTARDAVIYEDGEKRPQLWRYECQRPEDTQPWQWAYCADTHPSEFHVPEGSVLTQYQLDLRN